MGRAIAGLDKPYPLKDHCRNCHRARYRANNINHLGLVVWSSVLGIEWIYCALIECTSCSYEFVLKMLRKRPANLTKVRRAIV